MSNDLLKDIEEFTDDPRVKAIARMAGRQLNERKMGRPTKLNRVIASRVIRYVLEGNYLETACAAVGITRKTFWNWEQRALEWTGPEADWPDIPVDERIYVHFFHTLNMAENQAEVKLLKRAAAGERGWQAAMTVLERKYPARWGRQEKRIHSADPDKPPVIIVESDAERRQRVAKVLETAGALNE